MAQKYNSLECLLSALGDVDSLPDNWNSADYHVDPTIGVAESEATPYTVRLIATTDANEANREFRSLISAPLGGEAKDTTWTQEGIGSLSFKVSKNDPTCYATVSVNLQQMPKLQEIRFVPASVIGNNGSNKEPFYQFGDVIKQTISGVDTYWVCVRPASNKSDDLGKTHWCTFQLVPAGQKNANYKQINNDNLLPTDLCSKRSDGIRMTQNFFNVLRIMANPDALFTSKNLDKILI